MSRSLAELETSLVGKWGFENNFKDSSGNDTHGIPTDIEWKPTLIAIKPLLNGASSKIAIGDVFDGVKTISFYAQLSSTTEQLLDLNGTVNIDINTGTVQATNVTSPTIYIDGVATASLSDVTGFHQITITTATGLNVSALVVGLIGASYGAFRIDNLRMYSITFDATEDLESYNATKDAHGVIPAERSFTHRLSPELVSTIFATDMSTKDGYKLLDLSGNGNDDDVVGAVRSGGYFTDGMRFGDNDYITVPSSDTIDFTDGSSFSCEFLMGDYAPSTLRTVVACGRNFTEISTAGWAIGHHSGSIFFDINTDIKRNSNTPVSDINHTHVICVFDANLMKSFVYADGELLLSQDVEGDIVSTNPLTISGDSTNTRTIQGVIQYVSVTKSVIDPVERFNRIAALPIFSFNASNYPANDTVYTSNIPYSSMVVTSGAFKINLDNELECITTGTLNMRNSHKFDGSEYVTLDIGGVKTSGTGTATTILTSAGVVPDDNKVYVVMLEGEKLNRIDIQFRAPVE